ncbi:MAG: response regulator transcription factor, partial [Ruthenibacterium sp.]
GDEMRILMIEDDVALCHAVSTGLLSAGFTVDCCHDGAEGLCYLCEDIYDACLLDRMLPAMDGLTLLRNARAKHIATPVLMLTALGRVGDRVDGLDAGADDYLVKPFDMRELAARLRALIRRPSAVSASDEIVCGNTTLRCAELLLCGKNSTVTLSRKECDLLAVFYKNAGRLLSRSVLLGRVWGADAEVEDASLDSYIHFVRRRLSAVKANVKINTVRGAGYRLEVLL